MKTSLKLFFFYFVSIFLKSSEEKEICYQHGFVIFLEYIQCFLKKKKKKIIHTSHGNNETKIIKKEQFKKKIKKYTQQK